MGVTSAWGYHYSFAIFVTRAWEGLPVVGGERRLIRITRVLVWRILVCRGYDEQRAFVEQETSLAIKLTIQYLNKLGSNMLNAEVK